MRKLNKNEQSVLRYIVEKLPQNSKFTMRDLEESRIDGLKEGDISATFQSLVSLGYISLDNRLNLKIPHRCIICHKQFTDEKFYPFCSERCQLIDLYDWFEE